jgi:hypothetical protein
MCISNESDKGLYFKMLSNSTDGFLFTWVSEEAQVVNTQSLSDCIVALEMFAFQVVGTMLWWLCLKLYAAAIIWDKNIAYCLRR